MRRHYLTTLLTPAVLLLGLMSVGDTHGVGDGTGGGHHLECDDGLDNDGDGLVDLADPSCLGNPTNDTELLGTECDDGADNDSDGQIDLADTTCAGDASNNAEETACDDGVDNDFDGRIDLADAGCRALVTRDDESGEIVVNTTLDKVDANLTDGLCETDVTAECSLRAAIMQANWTQGPAGVQVPAGMFELTISPWEPGSGDATGDLDITDDVALIGAGAALTRIGGDEVFFSDQIFAIYPPARVDFQNLTIQKGYYDYQGGGIVAGSNTTVNLTDCLVTGNHGDYHGSGISSGGTLTLTNTTVTGNTTYDHAVGVLSTGTLTLTNSTVSGNTFDDIAIFGTATLTNSTLGSVFSDGVMTLTNNTVDFMRSSGTVTLIDSTVSSFRNNRGTATLISSTISNMYNRGTGTLINSTVSGGSGVVNHRVDLFTASTLMLENSTVTRSSTRGILTDGGATTYLKNSMVVTNRIPNCSGAGILISLGQNLISDSSCSPIVGDIINSDAKLGPLADNGGPTLTHLPLPGSPAIDNADNAACPATDQRGVARPIDGDDPPDGFADCDIGSVEVVPEPHGSLMLVAGTAFLALLYRRRTRGLRLG